MTSTRSRALQPSSHYKNLPLFLLHFHHRIDESKKQHLIIIHQKLFTFNRPTSFTLQPQWTKGRKAPSPIKNFPTRAQSYVVIILITHAAKSNRSSHRWVTRPAGRPRVPCPRTVRSVTCSSVGAMVPLCFSSERSRCLLVVSADTYAWQPMARSEARHKR
jgi:hypothetical protein